jgi:hypothetical protein
MAEPGPEPTFGADLATSQAADPPPVNRSGEGRRPMSRYERTTYFERLCALRASYETREVADRTGTISIAEVIGFAERELVAVAAPVLATKSDEPIPSESADQLN